MRKLLAVRRKTTAFIGKIIAQHNETYDEDNMRDFIDLYLKTEKSGETSGAMTSTYDRHISTASVLLYVLHVIKKFGLFWPLIGPTIVHGVSAHSVVYK